ncbi:MAG: hypothetical protein ACOYXC_01505 [Candidatus Rifleibacteriota bacterium]
MTESTQSYNPLKAKLFSAWGFFTRALLILLVFAIIEAAGWREYTSFISGTTSGGTHDILGIAYFIIYLLALFVSPVLIIGSGIFALITRLAGAIP